MARNLINWGKFLLLAAAILLAIPGASATITSAQLLDGAGTATTLNYDSTTESYADGSVTNTNIFVKVCSDDATTDLLNKFVGLFYKVGNTAVEIDVLPAKITSISAGCATVDLDFSLFKARYAGIPNIGVADEPGMNSPTYYQLTTSDGWLDGDFEVTYTESGSTVSASVSRALTEADAEITLSRRYLVLGIKDSGGGVVDSSLVELDESASLTKPSGTYTFNVNGIDVTGTGVSAAAVTTAGGGGGGIPIECIFINNFNTIDTQKPVEILIAHYCTYLRQINIGSSNTVSDIKVTTHGNVTADFVPPWGETLQYVYVDANLNPEDISIIKFIFRIPKTWISENSVHKAGGVKLNRFTDRWERLPTYVVDEDSNYVYYEAYSKGLSSYFAITGEERAVTVLFCGDGRCIAPETYLSCPEDCAGPLPKMVAFVKLKWFWILIALLLTMTIGFSIAYHHRNLAMPKKKREVKPEIPAMPETKQIEIPEHHELGLPAIPEIPHMPAIPIEMPETRIERHPHPVEIPEAALPAPVKVPRFVPKTVADFKKLPKRIAKLQRKVAQVKRKIESELKTSSTLKTAAARHAKRFVESKPARIKTPYIKKIKADLKLAEKELAGQQAKPVRQKLLKPVFKVDHHKLKPAEMQSLIRSLPGNIRKVEEAIEKAGKEIKSSKK